jgi:general secretion pathway protein E/type IV pilus assembly protein PilB
MNSTIPDMKAEVLQVLTPDQAWQYRVVPKAIRNSIWEFFIDEKNNVYETESELEIVLGKSLQLSPAPSEWIQNCLVRYYRKEQEQSKQVLSSEQNTFLENLISEAKSLKSSDIHIEAYEERCRVRIRIDGMLVERYVVDKTEYPSLINKIKIMSNLDIAEKRLPQDGRINFQRHGMKFDIRVSVLPTLFGEKIVLRILSNDATNIDIHQLGFSEKDLSNYLEGAKRPTGILLISGPTGSGKTTTLYATLKLLNKSTRNVLTIEDPIEYTLEGINHVQLKEAIGLNFGAALKTFLRQDPDIIMVGEIRDPETAKMAIRLAQTGHLVLSTIHTNSSWGTVARLIDMGIPPFLVASTLNTSVAQRLVRLLCPHCKKTEAFDESLYPRQFKALRPVHQHASPVGCEQCHYTGYRGRKAVYEVLPIDRELAGKIKMQIENIDEDMKERGVKTLAENAFELFENKETSIEEIYTLLM